MKVSEHLRKAIVDSGETHYRIGKESGVDTKVIDRFVSRERPSVRSETIDRLCEYLGLELQPKKQTGRKQPSKRPERGGK